MRRGLEVPCASTVVDEVALTVAGSQVHAEWHPAGRSRKAALLMHGFVSSIPEFGDLPARLADAGIGALAIDLRGHGRSRGEPGRIDLDRVIQDVDAWVAWLHKKVGRARLGLVGHSLGGSLALGVASRRDHFDAVVAAHPLQRLIDEVPAWQKPLYHVIGRRARRRTAKGHPSGSIPRDPRYRLGFVDKQAAKAAIGEGYLQRRVSLGNYAFAMTMDAADWAAKVKVPTLCIHSPNDRVVAPERSLRVFDALAGPAEHLVHKGGHSCFRDLDGDRVAEGTIEFLGRRLGGA